MGLSQGAFAELVDVQAPNISRYENGTMGVSLRKVRQISRKLGINPGWLIGWDVNKYPLPDKPTKMVPVLGMIAAGAPITASENIEGYECLYDNENADFCLRVRGDSMIGARIYDGDIVFIRRQDTVEHRDIAAVLVDGEDATLKRVYYVDGAVILHSENPQYPDRVFSKKEATEIKILGKAIALKGEIQ